MRVLFNALQAANRSGTGCYTVALLDALAALDEAPHITALWPSGAVREESARPAEALEVDAGALARIWTDQARMAGFARQCQADVVHYPANVGALRRLPCPSVLTVHDLSFLRHPEWFRAGRAAYYRWAVKRSARLATRVLADSSCTAEDLESLAGVPAGKIDVVPLGVDGRFRPVPPEECELARVRHGLPESFFLYVGTLEPRKNLERLVEAWELAASGLSQDLVLAGREGWKMEALREAVRRSPFRDRIHFPGFLPQEDLPALLGAADAFLWPSLFEGFGLPPLEAMACGAPVLTSNTSSLPEVVGDAALLVDPADTGAIAEGIRKLAGDDALCEALRAKGLERAAAFTWERCAELTLESYRRALG